MERLRFRKSGDVWTAKHKGHAYRVTSHPEDGYQVTRDGKRRYPYPIASLQRAKEVADDVSEFDVGKTTFRSVGHIKGPLELERDDGYAIRQRNGTFNVFFQGKRIGSDPTLFGAKKKVQAHAAGALSGSSGSRLRSAIRRDR